MDKDTDETVKMRKLIFIAYCISSFSHDAAHILDASSVRDYNFVGGSSFLTESSYAYIKFPCYDTVCNVRNLRIKQNRRLEQNKTEPNRTERNGTELL